MIFMCKALLTLGASVSPIAGALPTKILLAMMTQEMSDKVMGGVQETVAKELDRRCKEALVGDADYQMGDLTKEAILRFTGKDTYEFGDISRTIMKESSGKGNEKVRSAASRSLSD